MNVAVPLMFQVNDSIQYFKLISITSVAIVLDFIQTVWIFDPYIFCLDFIKKRLDFLSLENCLTFHASFQNVLAECGHFVVT